MVQHAWVFVLLLLAGLLLALVAHQMSKDGKDSNANKQNRGDLS